MIYLGSFVDWFFSPEYCKVLFYILLGFVGVFVLFRFLVPSLKPALESKIIAFAKKIRSNKNEK